MAFLVAVVLVVLGDCEGGVNNLLDLLTVPFVKEMLLLLLVELVAYLFLQGTPCAIVVNRGTEHIYSREYVAVGLLVEQ